MKIAVAGGYGIGLTMHVASAPRAGETVTGGQLSQGHGGKGSNQAVGAARLGAEVRLFTATGGDDHGRAAHEFWVSENIDAHAVVTTQGSTMVGFIIVDALGENRIAIAPGALAELTEGDAQAFRGAIAESDLLVVSLEIPLDVAAALLAIAREEGTPTLLNPAPAVELSDDVWAAVDYLTPNSSEAAILLGDDVGPDDEPTDAVTMAERLSHRFDGTVVLTDGASGAVVVSGGVATRVPAPHVEKAVDTTGAGDAFTSAFAVALAEGMGAVDAARFAVVAGAHAVTVAEVIPSLATREQLTRFHATLEPVQDSL